MTDSWKVRSLSLATTLGVAYILCAIFDILFPPFFPLRACARRGGAMPTDLHDRLSRLGGAAAAEADAVGRFLFIDSGSGRLWSSGVRGDR